MESQEMDAGSARETVFRRPAAFRYGIAVAASALGLAVRAALQPVLGNDYAFLPFFGSIAVAVTFGGPGPGLVATFLSYFLADYFFIHPHAQFNLLHGTAADWIRMLSFLAVGSTFNFFGWLMRRAQAEALQQRGRAEAQVMNLREEMARRRAAEDARASSELQFQTMFELTGSGIAQVDPATRRFVRVNPKLCQMTGYSESELLQKTVFELTHPEDRAQDEAAYAKVLCGQVSEYRAEKRYLRKDQTIFWVSVTANFLRDSNGRPTASLGIINDITERKMRTDELERMVAERTAALCESNADLETFSYSISHDLRAPLRAMQGFSQILFQELHDKLAPHHLQYLRRIMASATRMDALISDVLAYTRIVRSELALIPVDLDQLVRDIVQTYPQLRAENVDLQIEGPLPWVLGNVAALTQCVSNLLGNAVKFVSVGKRPLVRVRAELQDGHVILWVEDNGIGIAPEHQDRIFEMFNRLQDQYEGTGIGLTIVRKAVERMGGKVGLQSTPGEGTRFWIQLQAAAPEDPHSSSHAPDAFEDVHSPKAAVTQV